MCFSNSLPTGKHKTLDESLSLWVIEHMHKAFASIKRFSSHDGIIAPSDGHLIRKCGHGDTERLIESPSVTSHIAGEYQNRAWHAGVLAQSLLLIAPRWEQDGQEYIWNMDLLHQLLNQCKGITQKALYPQNMRQCTPGALGPPPTLTLTGTPSHHYPSRQEGLLQVAKNFHISG